MPPRPVSDFLPRPRLTDKLVSNLESAVTLVCADAGCGKTGLIADFVRNQERECVWYQLDHTDADPFTFIGYLVHGIRENHPGFGDDLLNYLDEAGDDLLRHPERAADLFLNEIFATIEQPFIIVLDDYHHIGKETAVHSFVDRILLYSSELLHTVVTSREIPPLAMMKHRARKEALVITRDDLRFADEEVKELFAKTLGVELSEDEMREYSERTRGWITALQLVRQVAEHSEHSAEAGSMTDLKEMLRRSEKDIFDYFAEEVFLREPEEIQDLLLRISILETMPLEECSGLFPEMRCSAVLPELTQRNVFISVAGDADSVEEYRLHPLFRDFLQRRLRSEIGRTSLAAERVRVAEFFIQRDESRKALPYLLDAKETDRAAELIAECGSEWLAGGQFTTLRLFAERLPDAAFSAHPKVLLHKAEVLRLQGDLDASRSDLQLAAKLLNRLGDRTGEAEALHSLASLERREGRPEKAMELLSKAEKLAGRESETLMKCLNTRGLCFAAQGNWAESERHFRLALELAEQLANEKYIRLIAHNLAIPTGFRGDFSEAKKWMLKIFREGSSPLPQEAIGHLNIARMHIYRGEFADAREHLKRSQELSRHYGLRSMRGEIFEAYGIYFREQGDLEQAAEQFERSREAYDEAGLNRFLHEVEEEYAACFRLRGDFGKARGILERLLEERKKLESPFGVERVRLAIAVLDLESGEMQGDYEKGLGKLLRFYNSQNLNFEEAQTALLLARYYLGKGRRKEMLESVSRVMELTLRLDYEHWLKSEMKRAADLFTDEDVLELLPADLREEAQASAPGSASQAALTATPEPLHDLTIRLLGHVDIFRDSANPLPADAWTTRRARDIFCFIASSRHRRAEKDVLIDTFWAEEDFDAVEKNFHPTISHIRKALNAKQAFKQNFIVFRDGAYQLNPELEYLIDVDEFEQAISSAAEARKEGDTAKAKDLLEQASKLYRGEFITGSYDDWALERRGYYSDQYATALSALAELAFAEEDHPAALRFARQVLGEDPFREDTHRLIMRILSAQGERAAVKKQFETLESLLMDELGVGPAPETVKTYNELVS